MVSRPGGWLGDLGGLLPALDQNRVPLRLAEGRGALVHDDVAGEADQDRCEDRASRALRHVPNGRGRRPSRPVRRHPAPHRPAQTYACSGMTDRIPLIHIDDRIGTPGTRSKGPFHRATAVNRPSIDGIGLKAAVAPEEVARRAVPGHTRPAGIDLYGEFRLVQRIRRYRNRNDIPTQSGRSCFRTVTMSAISSSVWDESLGKSRIMSSTRG